MPPRPKIEGTNMGQNRRMCATAAVITAGAIVLTLFAAGPAGARPIGAAEPRVAGPCALAREDGEAIQDFSIRLIKCAVDRWPVPGDAEKAICIAQRESGLIPTATSPTGEYVGLFQHSAADWPNRYAEWTRPAWQLKENPYNGRTNAIVTMRIVNAEGWGAWAGAGC
ncbi:MAG: hypothetical protein ACRDH7_07275 [Actinomycetota bacterium]